MRSFLTLLCVVIVVNAKAQNCSPTALMKEGAVLEYQSYLPKTNLFGKPKGYHKTVKLVFTVNAVRDSGSNTVSYITKQGISPRNPKKTYKKEIILACNEKFLRIPFDLFNPDTTFLADIYPAGKKWGIFTAHASLDRPSFLFIPHALENVRELEVDKSTSKFEWTVHDFMPGDYTANNRRYEINTNRSSATGMNYSMGSLKNELEIKINKVIVGGKETITTPAGSFDCYKIVLQTDMTIMKKSGPVNYTVYYDPAIGCVKFDVANTTIGGYVELIKVNR
jgi:hypothetical protein